MSWYGVGSAQKQEVSTGSHGRVMHTCSRDWQCALRSKACRRAEGLVSRTAETRETGGEERAVSTRQRLSCTRATGANPGAKRRVRLFRQGGADERVAAKRIHPDRV